jgi:large subunit ribosomal protein L25
VAGERIKLQVRQRESSGSRGSRRLRREGLVPGVLYGRGKSPHAICVPERELRRVLTGEHGLHAILDVTLDGQKSTHASVLKDVQRDAIRGTITHFDLQEVRLDQPISAQVVVELVGEEPPGVTEGGVLSQVAREVTVEALPLEMPDRLELDVSSGEMGTTFRVADLAVRDGATVLDDPETVVATITAPTRVVEPEPEVEELEEGEVPEGEELPEGEVPEGAAEESGAEAPAEGAASGSEGEPGTTEG